MTALQVRRLGVVPYADGLELQRRLVEDRKADRIPDTLLLLQHPHVLTIGVKKDGRSHILASPDRLASLGVDVFETGRGGDVTYHGPGQLVAYPIFDLAALDAFLARHAAFEPADLRAGAPASLLPLLDGRGMLRTLPFAHGLEAFFAAAVVRSR